MLTNRTVIKFAFSILTTFPIDDAKTQLTGDMQIGNDFVFKKMADINQRVEDREMVEKESISTTNRPSVWLQEISDRVDHETVDISLSDDSPTCGRMPPATNIPNDVTMTAGPSLINRIRMSSEAPEHDSRSIFTIISIDHTAQPFELRIESTKHVRDIMVCYYTVYKSFRFFQWNICTAYVRFLQLTLNPTIVSNLRYVNSYILKSVLCITIAH